MKRIFLCLSAGLVLLSCNNGGEKTATAAEEKPASAAAEKPVVDLPYTASYSSNWSADVSDADLKTVMVSYKDWETGNISGLKTAFTDSVSVYMNNRAHLEKTNADLMKMWSVYRDSLSTVRIDMEGWNKMYSVDKKDGYILTWYKEYDTYKDGKVDSANYHDINQVKNGKIVWYSQYKRKL